MKKLVWLALVLPLHALANPFTIEFCLDPDGGLADDLCVGFNLDRGRLDVIAGEQAVQNDRLDTLEAVRPPSSPPVGSVVAFAGPPTSVSDGWLLCDGSAIDSTDEANAALFAVIGETHGDAGDGVGMFFNLPDYSGRFLRGVDAGAGRDPDSGTRAAMNSGGNTGDLEGSVQGDATALPNSGFGTTNQGPHTHGINSGGSHFHSMGSIVRPSPNNFGDENGTPRWANQTSGSTSSAGNHSHSSQGAGGHTHSVTTGGDLETRPTNAYVNWIIRAEEDVIRPAGDDDDDDDDDDVDD